MTRPRGRDEARDLLLRGTADLDSLPTNAPVAFFPRQTLDVGAECLDRLTPAYVSLSLARKGENRGNRRQDYSIEGLRIGGNGDGSLGLNDEAAAFSSNYSRFPTTKGRTTRQDSRRPDEEEGHIACPANSTESGLNRHKPVRFLVAIPGVGGGPEPPDQPGHRTSRSAIPVLWSQAQIPTP